MSRKAKIFWGPWLGAMIAACTMILIGAFIPPDAIAQAKQVKAEKVLIEAKAVAEKVKIEARAEAKKILGAASPRPAEPRPAEPQPTEPQPVEPRPAGSAVSGQPAGVAAPIKPGDPQGATAVIKDAMHTSNWRLAVLAGLLLAVLLLRKVGGFFLPAKAGSWIKSDRGGAALALATGILTVVVNGVIAGGKFDPQLLVDGVLAAATTAGTFNIAKKLAVPSDLLAEPRPADAPIKGENPAGQP